MDSLGNEMPERNISPIEKNGTMRLMHSLSGQKNERTVENNTVARRNSAQKMMISGKLPRLGNWKIRGMIPVTKIARMR